MSIEQDSPTIPHEDEFQRELDREQAGEHHEYERRW